MKHLLQIILRRKLEAKQYATPDELRADVILVCENCYKYNPTSDPIHQHGRTLQVICLEIFTPGQFYYYK